MPGTMPDRLVHPCQMSGLNRNVGRHLGDGPTFEACGRIDMSELLGPIHPAQVVDGSTRLQIGQGGFLETRTWTLETRTWTLGPRCGVAPLGQITQVIICLLYTSPSPRD